MEEFLVVQTKQIAVTSETQEEAFKKVLNGEGKIVSTNLAISARPQPRQIGASVMGNVPRSV